MITDLLEAAKLACDAFFAGHDKSKLSLQETMRDLRCCVNEEMKRRAQDETQRITRSNQ